MDLMEMLLNSGGQGAMSQIARQFGLREDQAQSAVASLLPALKNGLSRNARQEGGLDSLTRALSARKHEQYLDDPAQLASPEGIADGNGILGHILGSKDVSRSVAARASEETGIGPQILKKMLPMVAGMVMGSLSRQTGQAGGLPTSREQPSGGLGLLTSLLDADGDGSAGDDVLGMLGKFFR